MEAQKLWLLLTETARQLGVEVRLESLDEGEGYHVNGGLCRLGDRLVAFVDRKLPAEARAAQLGLALAGLDLESIYLRPALREFLDGLEPPSQED